jgi:hypothetical protein
VAEARLMALTARIRPHFLFNSLNAVLGVIRSDPRRAEQALEELSDLFRVLMGENKDLVTLGEEFALCRQYLELERLRLGERLQVAWENEACPPDARVPPLMLQPLLENAVYHGIEPVAEPATVTHPRDEDGEEIRIVSNPYPGRAQHAGNRMALENIRERLMLFYDLEARLETEAKDGLFRVTHPHALPSGRQRHERRALRVFIVDDEAPARSAPEGAARRHRRRSAQRASSARRPTASRRCALADARADVALVDIRMPQHGRHRAGAPSGRLRASAGGGVHDRLRPVRRAGLRAERHRLPGQAGAAQRAGRRRWRRRAAPAPAREALARLAPEPARHLSVSSAAASCWCRWPTCSTSRPS